MDTIISIGQVEDALICDLRQRYSELEENKRGIEKKLHAQQEPVGMPELFAYTDFHTELENLIQVWEQKDFDTRKDFVNLFVEKAVLSAVATHWVQLELYWTMPGWENEVLFIFRRRGGRREWTDEERALLHEQYAEAEREVLLKALPEKSWSAIKKEAERLGIKRKSQRSIVLSECLTWNDWQFMQEVGIELEDRDTKVVPLSTQIRFHSFSRGLFRPSRSPNVRRNSPDCTRR